MKRIFSIGLILCLGFTTAQASWRSKVRAGDKLYEEGHYDDALVKYLEALNDKGDSTLVSFELGNVYQAQEKFDDAGRSFLPSLTSPDSSLRANALYNLGNALFGQQKYQEAAEAYKSALKLQPRQIDYLHNLQLAEYLLKHQPPQQQQQQQNQQNKDKNQDQQKQNDQQNQQQKDQQQQNKEQQQQQKQPSEEEQQQEKQQQEQQQMAQADTTLSKQDAERLLNALLSNEKQVLENLHPKQTGKGTAGKDW